MHSVHHLELFSQDVKVLRWTLLSKAIWSKVRQAEPRRSSAPLRDATPDSALRFASFIPSMTWSFYCTRSYRIFIEIHVLLKCTCTENFRTKSSDLAVLTNDYEQDDRGWVSRKHLELDGSPWRNRFSPKNAHISSSSRQAVLKGLRFSMLKSRTTPEYILLRFITKRASGITATSRHIPQLTRSNSSARMKRYRRLYPHAVQRLLCCLFPWVMLCSGIARLR